jgi:hypothetical protein
MAWWGAGRFLKSEPSDLKANVAARPRQPPRNTSSILPNRQLNSPDILLEATAEWGFWDSGPYDFNGKMRVAAFNLKTARTITTVDYR